MISASLRAGALIGLGVVLFVTSVLLFCARGVQDRGSTVARPAWPGLFAVELTTLSNAYRRDVGDVPLSASRCAADEAAHRAAALTGVKTLTHAPLGPVIRACAPMTVAAENLVRTDLSAAQAVDAWMKSPGHRANILDPTLTEVGAACVPDGTQLVCSEIFLGP